jgi:hypothetical protein
VLGGGWHFSTDVARAVGGGALTAEQGAAVLAAARAPATEARG